MNQDKSGTPASKASVAVGIIETPLRKEEGFVRDETSSPRQMLSQVLYRIRKGSERRFAAPSCQRLKIIRSHITVIQSYSCTVVLGDASISSVNWLWVPVSPFKGKFQSIFIQMSSSSRTLG